MMHFSCGKYYAHTAYDIKYKYKKNLLFANPKKRLGSIRLG